VLDGSQPLTSQDHRVLRETAGRNRIICRNKTDLASAWQQKELGNLPEKILPVSAKTGAGLNEVSQALALGLTGGQPEPQPGEVVVSQRQAQALARAAGSTRRALSLLGQEEPPYELVSLELAQALECLGQVDGKEAPDQVINAIFQNFCVGK
jgi:tRNA modification GTPase